ncbi:type VI secretion system protein TssL, long form [Roseomonas sp. NAR14]|uniref:Type VI secretion system protein TssL, long form n=1 Tax=Roseomonas acroporae TaxID=2937791 RepID=A0A9X1Y6K7_9PROT|nr:type VI secretion system protein TssL, long form [Roseomonas acroporae]MCK8785134.1 type VI secretion system protein TssL, long form [Roseomonas acroporae]
MSDNPFAEPEDADRTVVRGPGGPRPGGAQGGAPGGYPPAGPDPFAMPMGGYPAQGYPASGYPGPGPGPGAPGYPGQGHPPGGAQPGYPMPGQGQGQGYGQGAPEPAPRLASEAEALPKVGIGPLAAAAAPLLDLLARLANTGVARAPDPHELRERALRALRAFEVDADAAGVPAEQIRPAHYTLCAALDDVVLAAPWGASSGWSAHSLVATCHNQTHAGERWFDMLAHMQREPARYAQALEVAYLVLALGFQGQYRLAPRGAAELDRIRESLYQLLQKLRGGFERELSPHWRGVDAPHRGPSRAVPAWAAAIVAVALLGLGYAFLSQRVNDGADGLFERLAALPPARPPTIDRTPVVLPVAPPPRPAEPPAPPPDPTVSVRRFLQPEIDEGLVTVFGDAGRLVVRIRNRGMFASGSATVEDRFQGILQRIGQALRDEPGRVLVIGHTDSQPIRSMRFPSNFHLSTARAQAAMTLIANATGDASRFASEGRADAEPIGDNATAEGREQNRRVDVIVIRSAP